MAAPQLDLIGLVVEDMTQALAFYRALGLPIPPGSEEEDHVEITLKNGLRLAWDTRALIQRLDDTWQPPAGGHAMSMAFLCESPADVDSTFKRLTDQGYTGHTAPYDAFWGQRYAQITDPDGNIVDLFAPLPDADSD